jgi:hypothetical protein
MHYNILSPSPNLIAVATDLILVPVQHCVRLDHRCSGDGGPTPKIDRLQDVEGLFSWAPSFGLLWAAAALL